MPHPGQRPDTERIAEALHSASIRLLRMLRREDSAAGLTAPQLSALSVLTFGGPQKLGTLAAAEQVSLPTTSRLVAELERRGLAARTGDPNDRRASIIEVTDQGRALMYEGRRLRLARLVKAMEGLGAEDQNLLARAALLMIDFSNAAPPAALDRAGKPAR